MNTKTDKEMRCIKMMARAQAVAIQNGGRCLSEEWVNNSTHLRWQCAKGHIWSSSWMSVGRGSWCPRCSGCGKVAIEEYHEFAKERGGACLSKELGPYMSRLSWRCAQGHVWDASWSSIVQAERAKRFWCPDCREYKLSPFRKLPPGESGRMAKLAYYQDLATQKSGALLSDVYVNGATLLRWRCAEEHVWSAPGKTISGGSWCPECGSGMGERACRVAFETVFGKEFPKNRPTWLNGLELDGYCEELGLAFEYQGDQHFKIDGYMIKTQAELNARRQADKLKRSLCDARGVLLVEVTQFRPRADRTLIIREAVEKSFRSVGRPTPPEDRWAKIDYSKIYTMRLAELTKLVAERKGGVLALLPAMEGLGAKVTCAMGHTWTTTLEGLRRGAWCRQCARDAARLDISVYHAAAKEKGGQCLSATCATSRTRLRWRCAEGHEWVARGGSVQKGSWCRQCVINAAKLDISAYHAAAKEKGGQCLSATCNSNRTRLQWRCAEGHEWTAPGGAIRAGRWCPYCAGRAKVNISTYHAAAKEKGGQCLSATCDTGRTRLQWRCAEGHEWTAVGYSIQFGTWCPQCARDAAKLDISVYHDAAKKKGGQCLSSVCKTSRTRLQWRCAEGHEWFASGDGVRRGTWCPECARDAARTNISTYQAVARTKGGQCLSTTCKNGSVPLEWRCAEGHEWVAGGGSVQKGRWCPHCAGVAKIDISMYHSFARTKGGQCLSTACGNSNTRLEWRCAEGHEWTATGASVRGGTWCVQCFRKGRKLDITIYQAVALTKGGQCLSAICKGKSTPLEWRCSRGHEWTARAESVRRGSWCPLCANLARIKKRPDDVVQLALGIHG